MGLSPPPFTKKRAERLAKRGFELLDEGEYDEALHVADELDGLGYTACFEIRALALTELDRKEEAVAALEDGVAKAPSVWLLWQLLGNYRSDLGKYDDAHGAYARALDCPGVEESSVHLNRALALARQDRFEEAFAELDQVVDPGLELRRESSRVGFLLDSGRFPEAVRAAQETVSRDWGDDQGELVAAVQADLAWALHKMGASRDRVEAETWRSLGQDRQCQRALWILRELDGRTSESASYYRLLLQGRTDDSSDEVAGGSGFFVTYEVVADTPEDALALAARHEPEPLRAGLQLDECEALEPRPNEPHGVYWVSGRVFFPEDSTE